MSCCVLSVGYIVVVYYFTLEQLFQLPFILIVCVVAVIVLLCQPLFEKLLRDVNFTRSVQFAAMCIIVLWSTQCYEVSAPLFTIIFIFIKIYADKRKRFKTLKKKISSQELELVTVVK